MELRAPTYNCFLGSHLAQLMVKRDLHVLKGQTETVNRKSTSLIDLIVFAQDMAMYDHLNVELSGLYLN